MKQQDVITIMSGEWRGVIPSAMRLGLGIAEPGYRAAIALRNRGFDHHPDRAADLGRPTVSVGNLTTGGTGKTPVVCHLAELLIGHGHKPAILLRGYQSEHAGASSESTDRPPAPRAMASDEARLYQRELGDAAVVAADPDRVRSAKWVLHHHPDVTCFLLDDAFQHRKVARQLDLVLIDATQPFGFGHVLPRGLLREPKANLKRADAVIVTRADQVQPSALAKVDEEIQRLTGSPPIAHAAHAWTGFRTGEGETQRDLPPDALKDQPAMALCGIGNPGGFYKSLRENVERVVHTVTLADHAEPDEAALRGMVAGAAAGGAKAIVTTEKDWARMGEALTQAAGELPVYRPVLAISLLDGEEALQQRVLSAVGTSAPTA